MVTRRQAREWAIQLLSQFDLNPPDSLPEAFAAFWAQQAELEREDVAEERRVKPVFTAADPKTVALLARMRAFTETRVAGVVETRQALDERLAPYLNNWSVDRLGTIERNVLRLGLWELLNDREVPGPIVVNEAVDVAKWFSETKSGRFVNAVLDHVAKDLAKQAETEPFTP